MKRIRRHTCRSLVNYAIAVALTAALSFAATSIHANEPSLSATKWTSISTPSSPAKLSLQAAPTITLDHTRRFILRTVAKLNNYTQKPIELEVPNSCQVFRWEIVDADGKRIIQRPPKQNCTKIPTFTTLMPGKKVEKSLAILLAKPIYNLNTPYRLRFEFWHHRGEHEFRLE